MLSMGPATATVTFKYLPFKGTPPLSPMSKQRKASNQLLHLKELWVKIFPKSSEKTLSNKSKYLYLMITFCTK